MPGGRSLSAIFGSDHVAKIKIEAKEKYPLKGDPKRKTLDEMIKKAGKWMEVSDLNPWMLSRIIGRLEVAFFLSKSGEGVLDNGGEPVDHGIKIEGKRITINKAMSNIKAQSSNEI